MTLLIYLMFNRLDKFDGLAFEGLYIRVVHIRGAYIRAGGVSTRFYGIYFVSMNLLASDNISFIPVV